MATSVLAAPPFYDATAGILKGNGADLSAVVQTLFRGRQIVWESVVPSIKVNGQFKGSVTDLKRQLSQEYSLEFSGIGNVVNVRFVSAMSPLAGMSFEKRSNKYVLVLSKEAKIGEVMTCVNNGLTQSTMQVTADDHKVIVGPLAASGETLDEFFDDLDEELDNFESARVGDKRLFGYSGSDPVTHRVWALRNVHLPSISGSLGDDLALKELATADFVTKIINSALGTKDGNEVASANGHYIVLRGKRSQVEEAELLLATEIDVPPAQVHLDVWAVQLNTEAKSTEALNERLNRIHEGYQLTRQVLTRTPVHMTRYLRQREKVPPVLPALKGRRPQDLSRGHAQSDQMKLLSAAGFDVSPFRTLTPIDIIVLLGLANNDPCEFDKLVICEILKDIGTLKQKYAGQEGERAERLLALLDSLEVSVKRNDLSATTSAFGLQIPSTTCGEAGLGMAPYLAAYLDWHKPGKRLELNLYASSLRESQKKSTTELARRQLETDAELRRVVLAADSDLQEMFYLPLLEWVHEEVRDVSELPIVGRTQIVVDSRSLARLGAEAVSYHPRTPVEEREETDFAKVVTAADPRAALIDVLLRPEPLPIFTHISPGINLGVTPSVSALGDQAHLSLTLVMSVEASDPDKLQEKGLKPPDMVKSATMTTQANIVGYDLLQLATVGLTDTRRGDPWGIPVLQDIPLIGPIIFRYKGRPQRRHKEVLMFAQATILPRTSDLLP